MNSGAAQDIKHATQIARKMVVELCMSQLGPIYFGPQVDVTEWGQSYYKPEEISSQTQAKVDDEIKKIINHCYQKAKKIIKENRKKLDEVSEKLLQKESLERKEFEKIIKAG